MSPQNLRVRPGQLIRADHHNGLVQLAEQLTIQRGRLKGRRAPDGFTPFVTLPSSEEVADYAWRVEVDDGGASLSLTISPAHVSGVVPTIGGVSLLDLDADGEPPKLIVPAAAFQRRGRVELALLMLRYHLRPGDLSVMAVEPIAVPEVPAFVPQTWHKLLGFLRRFQGDLDYIPQAFFPQYFSVGKIQGASFIPYPRAGA